MKKIMQSQLSCWAWAASLMLSTAISKHFPCEIQQNKGPAGSSITCCWLYSCATAICSQSHSFLSKMKVLQCLPTSSQSTFLVKLLKRNHIQDELQSWLADFSTSWGSYFPSLVVSNLINVICLKKLKQNQEWKNAMLVEWLTTQEEE